MPILPFENESLYYSSSLINAIGIGVIIAARTQISGLWQSANCTDCRSQVFIQMQNTNEMSSLFSQAVQINDFSSPSCGRQSVGVSNPARCLFSSSWPFVLSVNAISCCLIFTGVFFLWWWWWWGRLASRSSRCSGPLLISSRTGRQRQRGRPSKPHQGPRWLPDRQTGTRPLHHPLAHTREAPDYICFPLRWRSKTSAERRCPTSGWLWSGLGEGRRQMEVRACE